MKFRQIAKDCGNNAVNARKRFMRLSYIGITMCWVSAALSIMFFNTNRLSFGIAFAMLSCFYGFLGIACERDARTWFVKHMEIRDSALDYKKQWEARGVPDEDWGAKAGTDD